MVRLMFDGPIPLFLHSQYLGGPRNVGKSSASFRARQQGFKVMLGNFAATESR